MFLVNPLMIPLAWHFHGAPVERTLGVVCPEDFPHKERKLLVLPHPSRIRHVPHGAHARTPERVVGERMVLDRFLVFFLKTCREVTREGLERFCVRDFCNRTGKEWGHGWFATTVFNVSVIIFFVNHFSFSSSL